MLSPGLLIDLGHMGGPLERPRLAGRLGQPDLLGEAGQRAGAQLQPFLQER